MPILNEVLRYDDARSIGEALRDDACVPTEEGWLRIDAVIERGDVVLPYRLPDGRVRWEFRPMSEVSDPESLASFEALPVTNEHPPVHLGTDNVKAYRVGQSGTPRVDGVLVLARLLLDDTSAMEDVRGGKRQISPGYRVVLDETPGEWNGLHYDAVQRRIRGNHIAIVPMGRQGPEVALRMDSTDAVLAHDLLLENDMPKNTNNDTNEQGSAGESAMVDALALKLDAMISAKLDGSLSALTKRVDEMGGLLQSMSGESDSDKEEEEDSEIPKLDGADAPRMDAATRARLDSLEAQVKQGEAQRKADADKHRADMVEAELRSDVLATAKRVIGDDYTGAGKSRLDVMADVIVKVDGDDAKASIEREKASRSDGASGDSEYRGYVRARFDDACGRWSDRQDAGEALLKAAKDTERGDGGEERKDIAGDAKAAAEARKQGRWKKQ